ncbi:allatotropin-like [Linepithema humile]|uniref:allatotropin-like n=1 Tax=Linepithema humile TaxID=83485 RepID=UPI0006239EB3|nr:PREDICTED: uncharacterized protein LOC105679610 [Linepithema humile]
MRAVLAIALVLVAGFFVVATATTKGRNYPRFFKHRTKLREIRGFKPEYISTAIGFGKRESPMATSDLDGCERILSSLLRSFPHGIPADVLLPIMQTNPALASKLTHLSMQNDQGDEESMMDHSQPERTLALF